MWVGLAAACSRDVVISSEGNYWGCIPRHVADYVVLHALGVVIIEVTRLVIVLPSFYTTNTSL